MPRVAIVGVPPRRDLRRLMTKLSELGYAVVTVDTDPDEPFADTVEASIRVPSFGFDDVIPELTRYHGVRPLDGVALFHELSVEVSTRAAAALGLPHFPVADVAGCTDKLGMRRWMRRKRIPCPPFAGVVTLDEARVAGREIGYPMVVKPARGAAGYGVTRIDEERDLERFFANTSIFWEPRQFILERFMPGHEVSVETVTDADGGSTHAAVFDKPQVLDGPYFLTNIFITTGCLGPAELTAARDAVSDMIVRLELKGCVTHTELRLTPDGPVVIEFGLRPIGWPGPLCVEAATGVDLVAAMAAIACGEQPDVTPYDVAVAGWRYLTVSKTGTVTGLPHVNAIRARKSTIDASVWAAFGDRVGTPPEDFHYVKGYLAAVGSTPMEVAEALRTEDWVLSTSP